MGRLRIVLEMIKFEHAVFALPFAFLGAFLAARGCPDWRDIVWIVLAMVGARSSAMGFNRLVDREFDRLNPRTAGRALPRGILTKGFVLSFVLVSVAVFLFSAWMLNPVAFALSPLALLIILRYSYTKRFTSCRICCWVLTGDRSSRRLDSRARRARSAAALPRGSHLLGGGFDIIYARQTSILIAPWSVFSAQLTGYRASLRISTVSLPDGRTAGQSWLFRLSFVSWIGLGLVVVGSSMSTALSPRRPEP
jgi:putative 4-hydroxybenzoate polyprenyltransferase